MRISFNEWLDIFIEEKGLEKQIDEFIIEHKDNIHIVDFSTVIDLCKKTSKEQQSTIKDALVYLDFKNANFYDYFNHLAICYIKTNY